MRGIENFTLWIVLIVVASIALTFWLLVFGGADTALAAFWKTHHWIEQNYLAAIAVFFVVSLISQLIIMPSGSLILLVAGFTLGAIPAAGAFAVAQVLAAWPVYVLSRTSVAKLQTGSVANRGAAIKDTAARLSKVRGNDVVATLLLRLTPVLPSAAASALAALAGIRFRSFLIGTVLCCWIRPLFFAGSGESMSAFLLKSDAQDALSRVSVMPLLLIFLSALLLYILDLWLKRKAG